jgi:hypothetical protein
MKPEARIGMVGVGAIAQLAHLPALAKLKGVELAALCDKDRPKAAALAERFSVGDVLSDIEDLLGRRGGAQPGPRTASRIAASRDCCVSMMRPSVQVRERRRPARGGS